MAVVGAHNEFEKYLTETDVKHKLVVPMGWLQMLLPPFEEGTHEVHFGVLDSNAFYWPLSCSIRNGGYPRPVLQADGWLKFVNFKGLKVGDKIILEKEVNQFRETQLKIRAQRLNIHNNWIDF